MALAIASCGMIVACSFAESPVMKALTSALVSGASSFGSRQVHFTFRERRQTSLLAEIMCQCLMVQRTIVSHRRTSPRAFSMGWDRLINGSELLGTILGERCHRFSAAGSSSWSETCSPRQGQGKPCFSSFFGKILPRPATRSAYSFKRQRQRGIRCRRCRRHSAFSM